MSAVADALAACEAQAFGAVTAIHAERARARDGRLGPLSGVPFAAKDLFDVEGRPTRAGSRSRPERPAPRDAAAIRRLEEAGAVLVASAQMDELAYGFSGENHHDGDCRNPHDPARSAGGSSSGSAALVAAGAVPLALGTDTNGSVRVPAALCGVWGLKPTYGRVSRAGVVPFVRSLDHVGALASSADLLRRGFEALDGPDADDPVSATGTVAPNDRSPARLGGWFAAPLHADVAEAVQQAEAALAPGGMPEVVLDLAEAARAAAFVITNAEGGQEQIAALRERPEGFGPLVRDRLRAGALLPATWVARAQKLRRRATAEIASLLDRHPLLIAPATPCSAFPLGAETHEVAGRALAIRLDIGLFTQCLTLTGVPVLVAPRMGAGGLPVGVQ